VRTIPVFVVTLVDVSAGLFVLFEIEPFRTPTMVTPFLVYAVMATTSIRLQALVAVHTQLVILLVQLVAVITGTLVTSLLIQALLAASAVVVVTLVYVQTCLFVLTQRIPFSTLAKVLQIRVTNLATTPVIYVTLVQRNTGPFVLGQLHSVRAVTNGLLVVE
jgi:hypothetical protein